MNDRTAPGPDALFRRLQSVTSKIHDTQNIDEIILDLSSEICDVFDADRLTIYAANEDRSYIVSKVKTGLNNVNQIKVPVLPEYSVAGYVACNKKLLNIRDAYDAKELASFDPPVTFYREVDAKVGYKTRELLVGPILDPRSGDLMGVVQIINRKSRQGFDAPYEEALTELCRTLAIAFRTRTVRKPVNRSKFERLIVEGVVSTTQFDLATTSARQKKVSLEDYLRRELQVQDSALGEALSHFYRVPYEPFRPDRQRPIDLMKNMKRDYVESHGWLPIEERPDAVVVLATDPEAVLQRREPQNVLGRHKVEYRVCTQTEFAATVDQFFSSAGAAALVQMIGPEPSAEDTGEQENSDLSAANDNEVVKAVNQIIVDAYNQRASDIHIEPRPGRGMVRIRFRKDGELVNYAELPARLQRPIVARIKIMTSQIKPELRQIPQDGKIKFKEFHPPLDIELRVATIPTAGGVEDVVMRILASGKPIPLDQLGLSKHNLKALGGVISKPYGLFFVCGPTGSGKTTTLHSVLSSLNTEGTKIWTAEDPVEITQDGLRQVQINKQQKLTFDVAMRSFLRADPDVIMVGEMRDKETVSTGIEASLTGHLVLATLHTNSAPESIIRLLDMGMDPFNFADALLGVLAQRLARRLCPDCRKPRAATQEEIKALIAEYSEELRATDAWKQNASGAAKALYEEWVRDFGDEKGKLRLWSAPGCDKCGKSGYRGRVGLHELLVGTDAMKKDIQEHARVAQMFTTALNDGMRTLKQDGIEKSLAGLTDLDQVRKVCIK